MQLDVKLGKEAPIISVAVVNQDWSKLKSPKLDMSHPLEPINH
jgi:hypothetical protein